MDIIQKVTEPTEWVNALVAVEKPKTGKLRVCLDTRPLNKAIQRPHYPLLILDDITPRLALAQYFSLLNARSGYWAIKLSHESSMLTTFNTVSLSLADAGSNDFPSESYLHRTGFKGGLMKHMRGSRTSQP